MDERKRVELAGGELGVNLLGQNRLTPFHLERLGVGARTVDRLAELHPEGDGVPEVPVLAAVALGVLLRRVDDEGRLAVPVERANAVDAVVVDGPLPAVGTLVRNGEDRLPVPVARRAEKRSRLLSMVYL